MAIVSGTGAKRAKRDIEQRTTPISPKKSICLKATLESIGKS